MSELVNFYTPDSNMKTYLKESEKHGKHLYKQNNNYRNIANCLEHPEFRELFDNHFSSWDKVKDIFVFLKLYKDIEKSSLIELNGYQKLSILDNIMKDKELRHNIYRDVHNQINLL
jgi:hypothetical protein